MLILTEKKGQFISIQFIALYIVVFESLTFIQVLLKKKTCTKLFVRLNLINHFFGFISCQIYL